MHPNKYDFSLLRYGWKPLIWALVMLFSGLSLTAYSLHATRQRLHDEAWLEFSQQFDRVETAIRAQFTQPLYGIRGAIGAQASTGNMRRANFRAYVATRDIATEFPGIRGFGYIERVMRPDLGRFEAANQADQAPDFAVNTQGDAPDLYVVKYIEPLASNRAAQGMDLGAEPIRREAIERAINSGTPSLSGALVLPQDERQGAAFLYLVPVFSGGVTPDTPKARRAALTGLFYSPLVANELLKKSAFIANQVLDFELLDGLNATSQTLVFSSQRTVAASTAHIQPVNFEIGRKFHKSRIVPIGGRFLTLRTGSSVVFESKLDRTTPLLVGVGGMALSLLLSTIVWLSFIGRARAETLAHVMTKDIERLATVVRRTSHLVLIGDADRNITWVNEAFSRLTGLSAEQAIGQKFDAILDPVASGPQQRELFRNALDRQESLRLQYPQKALAGETVWLDLDLQPEKDAAGSFSGYVAIASDVSAQRAAADQLVKAMRENQALMNAIDQYSIVSIANPAGNITYINEQFSSISGYSREELMGQNHRIVNSNVQPAEFWTAMWQTISSGHTWRDVVCNRAKNGSLYWVDTFISPFFDDKGIERYVAIGSDITAARAAQQALAFEREHLSNIIMGTHAGTWEWNVQTGDWVINERWADIIGYALQELTPVSLQTWSDHCHPDDLKQASQLLALHLEGGLGYYDCQIRMRHRDGHWVWVQARGKTSSWTADGKPEWMSGTHMDISEQKHAEENLRRNNTVMQSILDNIPVGLSAFDGDLHLIAKNRHFQTQLDLPDALFDEPATTFESIIRFNADRGEYGEGDQEATIQAILERTRHPAPHQFERVRPNGMALEVRGAPIPGGGFVTTYADISERKRAEAEIERTSTMLQSVLDSASEVGMISIGVDRTVTLFNSGAERMLGYPASEIVGQHTPELFHDPAELEARATAMSAELGRPVAGIAVLTDESMLGRKAEWTYIRKDASRIVVAMVVTSLSDARGVRTGYLGVSHDISTEKAYENWLRGAMEEAEAATIAKSQFLANMSHEIRTPMNAILGMLKLLQNTELSPRQLDYTTKTEGAAKSLLGLLNDILDFSKMDAGKMTLDPQPFRLDRLMRDLSVILSANLGEKPVEVLFDIDPRAPRTLIGDAMRLQQVLINLSGNAIKFTAHGEVVIQVKVMAQTGLETTLRISVRDSGIGIAPENQKHIFDGFSQAEASTTRRYGGTGLGLSISRRLVALMGAELALDSILGQGSTFHFTITLPAVVEVGHAPDACTERLASPLNVLVVDDNAVARDLLVTMAQSWGWQVDAAASGAQALALVEARVAAAQPPYQTIFMDWEMPGMNGWETIARMREMNPEMDAPITVMVTAHGREMLSKRSAQEQARLNAFLVKPITASMLFDAVADARAGHGNLRASPRASPDRQKRLEGMRLLVVEDNLINQQVARELLSAQGALVEIADNGQLGVAAVASAKPPFDAVLMDIQMPVMDGYTATRAIRHDLGLTQLPVIAMTANAMASDREACLAAGMNDHVGKPFDLPHLVEVLLNHTRRLRAGAATQTMRGPGMAADDAPDTLPPTGTVDVDGALARLDGNTELYARILQSYLGEITGMPDQLDALLQSGGMAGAARLLHTLKGLSATVGASYMAAMAKAAESAVKTADAAFQHDELRVRFREAVTSTARLMSQIARDIAPALPQTPPRTPHVALDTHRLVADLRELQGLLSSSDMRALQVHAELRHAHASGAADELNRLDAAVAAFDFAQGVVQCETLLKKFSPST